MTLHHNIIIHNIIATQISSKHTYNINNSIKINHLNYEPINIVYNTTQNKTTHTHNTKQQSYTQNN